MNQVCGGRVEEGEVDGGGELEDGTWSVMAELTRGEAAGPCLLFKIIVKNQHVRSRPAASQAAALSISHAPISHSARQSIASTPAKRWRAAPRSDAISGGPIEGSRATSARRAAERTSASRHAPKRPTGRAIAPTGLSAARAAPAALHAGGATRSNRRTPAERSAGGGRARPQKEEALSHSPCNNTLASSPSGVPAAAATTSTRDNCFAPNPGMPTFVFEWSSNIVGCRNMVGCLMFSAGSCKEASIIIVDSAWRIAPHVCRIRSYLRESFLSPLPEADGAAAGCVPFPLVPPAAGVSTIAPRSTAEEQVEGMREEPTDGGAGEVDDVVGGGGALEATAAVRAARSVSTAAHV